MTYTALGTMFRRAVKNDFAYFHFYDQWQCQHLSEHFVESLNSSVFITFNCEKIDYLRLLV
jgi:hypothetical protein